MASSPQPASPRRSRGFSSSGRSDKTHRSSGSGHRLDLTESHEEKVRRSLQTKADPMLAMNEAQPNLVALEKSNLGSLRALQHKDQYGNPITEPDLSNPTRPRFERPLDTIRSFEAAIYGPYSHSNSRPASYARTAEESPSAEYSRRNSYYNGPSNGQYNDRGHYNNRPNYSRPNSYVDNGNGYSNGGAPPENYYPYSQTGGRPRPRQHPSRGYSDQPTYASGSGYQNGHAQNGYYKSSDNITAASPSGSGSNPDQWGNSTDPSSINSSIDQLQQQQQERAMAEAYGFNGFGPGPDVGDQITPNAVGKAPYGQAPPPPAHAVTNPNIGGPVGGPQQQQQPQQQLVGGRRHLQRKSIQQQSISSDAGDNGTKRKSWFKRTFTKN
ncbi:hypothetical protein BJY01DRAFT_168463 [Aspergillus pseudoustus]|uniref:DUF2406 domain protein n=1 Tax=Aspergillus pseudoustus TaxID=1810923 RepID=A0ABR4K400_9EURO